jgi:hypothetical protein
VPVASLTHPLAGRFSADESARLIRNYRYAVERMMRILGGWIALTPELSAKLLMGRHVWDNAQHADAFGRRLPELRAQAHVSEPANEAFVAVMDAIEEPELPGQTVERVVGVYGVLKPHLLASYEEHLGLANEVYEPPTRRILTRCAEDERRHIAAGLAVLGHLVTTSALEERASARKARLEQLIAASGGVTGRGVPPAVAIAAPAVAASDDARELIRLEQSASGWSLPEDLECAVQKLGDALIARDPARICGSFLPGAAPAEEVESTLAAQRLDRHRIVALAKVGRQPLVKLRVEGPDGSIALVVRWMLAEDGWRAAAIDIVATDPAQPA